MADHLTQLRSADREASAPWGAGNAGNAGASDARAAALSYLARGWSPVFYARDRKGPTDPGWPDRRVTAAEIQRQSRPCNVGVILGAASCGLTDVDLDSPHAVAVAPAFLPDTGAVFGRSSKPASHWIYVTDLAERIDQATLGFKDPETNQMIVELRFGGGGLGAQTMFPGSVHPATGEPVEWLRDGDPARVDGRDLQRAVRTIAAAALLASRWAAPGGQHDDQLALLALLARQGWGEDEAVRFACAVIGAAGGQPNPHKRRQTLRDAYKRLDGGRRLRGWPAFKSRFGDRVAERVAEWLEFSLKTEDDHATAWANPDLALLGTGRRPAPEFPADLLGAFWSRWAMQRARAASAPIDYVAVALLASAGAAIANVRWPVAGATWSEPPLLWCGLVGSPSSGKSPAMDASVDLIRHAEDQMGAGFEAVMAEHESKRVAAEVRRELWERAVEAAIKAGESPPPMPEDAEAPALPVQPRIRVTDATLEKLGLLAAGLPRGLLLVRDELAGWLGAFDRYGGAGADRAFALEMYGGRAYAVDRVKHAEPIRIRHLSVGVLGSIQPDRLAGIIDGPEDGLVARFLWCWPEAIPDFALARTPIEDAAAREAFSRLVTLAMDTDEFDHPEPRRVHLSAAAENALEEFAREMARRAHDAHGIQAGMLGKARGHALRLATVLEILWWVAVPHGSEPEAISEGAVLAACALMEAYFVPMAQRVFGDASLPVAERRAMVLARHLQREGLTTFNMRDLRRQIGGALRDTAAMRSACDTLVDARLIRPQAARAEHQIGRRPQNYEVSPVLLGRDA